MTNTKIKFDGVLEEFLAVRIFASNDESRYVLNGVRIESTPENVLFVATDGRRLVCVAANGDDHSGEWSVTVPCDLIDKFCKAAGKKGPFRIEFDGEVVTMSSHGIITISASARAIQGTYPDWRKTVPDGPNEAVKTLGLNPSLLADFKGAAKLLAKEAGLTFGMMGDNSPIQILIDGAPNFWGLIMPMRDTALEVLPAGWLALK